MDTFEAAESFAALSQPSRLEAFHLLVKAGAHGVAAGEIARQLEVRQNTMSANLSVLLHAGLVRRERDGRIIRYFADFDAFQRLMQFLIQDCCGGNPAICSPLMDVLSVAGSCAPGSRDRAFEGR